MYDDNANAPENAGSAMDELLNATRELRDNLARLLGASRDLASEKIGNVRESATDLLQRGRQRANRIAEGTGDYVREEPWKAMLIAAGAGLLVGWLLKRRR